MYNFLEKINTTVFVGMMKLEKICKRHATALLEMMLVGELYNQILFFFFFWIPEVWSASGMSLLLINHSIFLLCIITFFYREPDYFWLVLGDFSF